MTAAEPGRPLPFGAPSVTEEEIAAVAEVLRSGWLTGGPKVRAFEEAFARYVGAPHALATSSCTAAMELALRAAGIGDGDEVILPALTFSATAAAVHHVGATPVLVDVGDDGLLDVSAASAAARPRTRALVLVHLWGRPADVDRARVLADCAGLFLLADCAHAIEAEVGGTRVGGLTPASAFSFYATKDMTTGEGGMLTAEDPGLIARARAECAHGLSRPAHERAGAARYEVVRAGRKRGMAEVEAALGLGQLARIEAIRAHREAIFRAYDEGLRSLPLDLPPETPPGTRPAPHLYVVRLLPEARLGRDALAAALAAEGIGTGVHFRALTLEPFWRERLGVGPGSAPRAEAIGERVLSLPVSNAMSLADAARAIEAVRRLLG